MIYVLFNKAHQVSGLTEDHNTAVAHGEYENRNNWKDLETVEVLATALSHVTGDLYIGFDKGRNVGPRFDIFKAPKIGDEVSMGFNGDYYPCGVITSISKTMKKITTANGTIFYRRGQGARWLNKGTFAMVPGVHNERNPHF